MPEPFRVVLVDDHPLFREGVAHSLTADPDFDVIAEGESADDALRLAQELLPDLMVLDLNMPGGGINAVRSIAASCPFVRLVVLTVSEEEDDVLRALRAGTHGYVLKGINSHDLRAVLRGVAQGESWVSPTLAASLLVEMKDKPAASRGPESLLDELTERERQILEGVAAGSSNKEIGQQLFLTEKTVKHYMTNILQKLQVRNRVEAALLAQRARADGPHQE
ncbi:MAG: two-component system, NarL family, nitrate/nitrite response regulator NarL [Chloroflexota bacterium]|jgi:DNA-binding NarL/FixJ family response regulator|nr:two-component system, NarL family, nitrate/nitrite response regulator NarL [Chloroflexota bacterium]